MSFNAQPNFVTDGVVLGAKPFGETDLVLTLLTPEHGRMHAKAKGVGKDHRQSVLYTQNYVLSSFSMLKKTGLPTILSADVKQAFLGLKNEFSRMALAQYLADVAAQCPMDYSLEALFPLLLNSFYLLAENTVDERVVKIVFELKYGLSEGVLGEPACAECGKDPAFWSYRDGFFCADHGRGEPIDAAQLAAIRHILSYENRNSYLFSLSEPALENLSKKTSGFIESVLEKRLDSLDFYLSVKA